MAHSYDSTLLQRMGFRDQDRKTPTHDKACVSLVTSASRLIERKSRWGLRGIEVALEVPLQKGDGKYASTVGFIDALITWNEWFARYEDPKDREVQIDQYRCRICMELFAADRSGYCPNNCKNADGWGSLLGCETERLFIAGPPRPGTRKFSMLVEIKTKIDSIGDLLRQLNLYREYGKADEYMVWSLAEADLEYADLLRSQGYDLVVGTALDRLLSLSPRSET